MTENLLDGPVPEDSEAATYHLEVSMDHGGGVVSTGSYPFPDFEPVEAAAAAAASIYLANDATAVVLVKTEEVKTRTPLNP